MRRGLISLILLGACATAPAPLEPPLNPIGRVHYYVRSNQGGSMNERVTVYRESEARTAVYKMVQLCTNAAYVTGDFDMAAGEARRLVGGRLSRQGTQDAFATLTLDPTLRTITTHVDLPDGDIDETLAGVTAPWIMYDFDLADLTTLFGGRPAPRSDFSFTVVMAWPEAGVERFVQNLGRADVRFVRAETRRGHQSLRYRVSGALNGALWLDARDGYVVEARFAEPNHPGYQDFALVLLEIVESRPDGPQMWAADLAAHWRDCPPA